MANQLVVLRDSVVFELLINLSKEEILELRHDLLESLRSVSIGVEGEYQPPPGVINRPDGQKILFRPFTSPDAVGTKIVVDPALRKDGKGDGLHGVLVVCDESGHPRGLINAEELTGFRTALTALIPYVWRRETGCIVVFGAGKQALWHIRLALALRGSEIQHITIVNRSVDKAQTMIEKVENENRKYWKSLAKMTCIASSEALEPIFSSVDVVFCTVPTTSILFTKDAILATGNKPLITAIGSWQPQMVEVDPQLVQHIARADPHEGVPYGAVLVDDIKEGMKSSGELIQSGLRADEIFEIGRVFDWKEGNISSSPSFGREHLDGVLSDGLIVYKSVGVSVTDLAMGSRILSLADRKALGLSVADF